MTALSKLLQKSHIVLEQQADVVQLINSRAGAIDSETESESGELFGIDVRRAQNVRMHHARSAQLDPAGPLTDATARAAAIKATVVDFRARLSEWKIRRPKARFGFRS